MKKQIILTIKLLFLSSFLFLNAQNLHYVLTSGGGNATGSNGNLSFTIGQVFYQTIQHTQSSILTGVQVPFEILTINSDILYFEEIELISAYPNPAADNLILKVKDIGFPNMYYQLIGTDSKVLLSGKVTNLQTCISMTSLLTSTYFLRIYTGNREIKTFKIIKK